MNSALLMQGFLVFADHLIEIMGSILAIALVFRLLASRASRRDQIYFKTFARAIEKTLDSDEKFKEVDEAQADDWLKALMDKVTAQLPDRNLRFSATRERQPAHASAGDAATAAAPGSTFRFRDKENFTEFAEGKRSIAHGIRSHVDVLKAKYPPNFGELAYRILDQDRQWKTVSGVPIEIVSRMLDILPGLFVIGGILGTFIGISNSLPMIGKIDMSHINESAPVLAGFIDNISLSMRTSIAGIMYSVAMTVLNTTFPIHSQRADVEKSVQRCLEILWNRIHADKLSFAETRTIQLLEHIAANRKDRVA